MTSIDEVKDILEKLESVLPDSEDPTILANIIFQSSSAIVLPLANYGHYELAVIIACFSALLEDLFVHKYDPEPYAAGMRKLIELLASPENEKAALISKWEI
jgi:hypothetical protein